MAASITGTFTIVDRASSAMKKMERQAAKTMAAIEALGAASDKAGGGNSAASKFDEQTRVLRNTERQARATGKGMDDLGTKQRNAGRETESLGAKLRKVGQTLGGLGRILQVLKFAALGVGIAVLAQAVGTLAGGFVALIPAVAQASAAIAALPQVVSAAVQGMVVLKLAFSGVGNAVSAGMKLQQQAGQVARDTAEQQRQAAHSVQMAEQSLQSSQYNSTQAQQALTAARRDAIRNLTDLKFAAQGADLAQQRSALSLRQARQNLAQAAINPQTTDLQMRDLQLSVKEAQLGLKQSKVDKGRSISDRNRAMQQGVGGNPAVVQANHAVTDAMNAQKNAAWALADAQRQAARTTHDGVSATNAYQQAMKNLSPEARTFVKQLVAMKPAMDQLKASAGKELFPALGKALEQGAKALPMLNRVSQRTGGVLGRVTQAAVGRFTTKGRLNDIEGLGNQNATILGRMGKGASNLGAALLDLMVAARPFTNWLTKTLENGTEWVAKWSRAQRLNGNFAKSLDRTKDRLKQFGDIMKNLWTVLRGVLRAATPLGDRLWSGFDKATKGWAAFADSTGGQAKMTRWFDALYPGLHELGKLTKDLALAWARITVSPSFANTISTLDKYVPDLEGLFKTGGNMGPAFANALGSLVKFFNAMPLNTLTVMLDALAGIVNAATWLVEHVPGLKYALSGLLMTAALSRSVGLVGKLLGNWQQLFRLWGSGGGPGGVMGPGGGAGGTTLIGGGGGRSVPGAYGAARKGGFVVNAAGEANRIAPKGRIGSGMVAAGAGMRGLGALALPMIGIGGLLGAAQGAGGNGAMGLWRNFASGGSFGAIRNQATVNGQQDASNFGALQSLISGMPGGANPTRLTDVNAQIKQLRGARGRVGADTSSTARERKVTTDAINAEIQARKDLLPTLAAERDQRRAGSGQSFAASNRHALKIDLKHTDVQAAYTTYVDQALRGIDRKGPGAKIVAQDSLDMLKTAARTNPQLKGQYDRLTRGVERRFSSMGATVNQVNGNIYTGSNKEWKRISAAISTPAEQAKERASTAFTQLQEAAIGSLEAMGYSRSQAKKIVASSDATGNTKSGNRARQNAKDVAAFTSPSLASPVGSLLPGLSTLPTGATGMRIPGSGRADTVPLTLGMAAPGELVVNRHTEQRVNGILGMAGTSLGREVAGESRKHSEYALGGRTQLYGGVTPGMGSMISQLDGMGFAHGSTTGGTHAANSYHYRGEAVDFGDATNDMQKLWSVLYPQRGQFAELFGPSYLTPGPTLMHNGVGFVDPSLQAGHNDHIHVALAAALAGGLGTRGSAGVGGGTDLAAMMVSQLVAPTSSLGGVPGAIQNAAMQAVTTGLNGVIASAAGVPGGGGGVSFGSGRWQTEMSQIAKAKRWNLADWQWLVNAESSGDPTAVNKSSGAFGLGQFLGATKTAYAPYGAASTDPVKQIDAMGKYIDDRYQNPTAAKAFHLANNWYDKGGRTPQWGGWHAKGGQFTVSRPTLFGAGEAGTETVNVSKGSGGGKSIAVHIERIENHREGDIAKMIEREMALLADDLDRA